MPGTAGRFFPIEPLDADGMEWFENELFVSTIPDSAPSDQFEAIHTFQKHVHKEHPFQSRVEVEGHASPDEASVVTTSELFDSFIDNSSVSQGSFFTPPDIKAIPLPIIVNTVNTAMAQTLGVVKKRRIRIIDSSDESQQAQATEGTAARGGGASKK